MIIDHFYRNILESLPQLVLVATPLSDPSSGQTDFLIEYVNPAWERISGSTIQTVQGKLLSQTVYADTAIPWAEIGTHTLQDGKPRHLTVYSELVEKWLDISATVLEPGPLCVHVMDVTEMKQGEMRLKEQNLRLSSLSAELAASKNNLKLKLEKIENLNNNLLRS